MQNISNEISMIDSIVKGMGFERSGQRSWSKKHNVGSFSQIQIINNNIVSVELADRLEYGRQEIKKDCLMTAAYNALKWIQTSEASYLN